MYASERAASFSAATFFAWLAKCAGVHAPTNRPVFCQWHAIPSSAISRSISPNASAPSASNACVRSAEGSSDLPEKLLPIFTPPLTAPPFRVLAPKPSSAASSTTQSTPCFAASSAVDSPA